MGSALLPYSSNSFPPYPLSPIPPPPGTLARSPKVGSVGVCHGGTTPPVPKASRAKRWTPSPARHAQRARGVCTACACTSQSCTTFDITPIQRVVMLVMSALDDACSLQGRSLVCLSLSLPLSLALPSRQHPQNSPQHRRWGGDPTVALFWGEPPPQPPWRTAKRQGPGLVVGGNHHVHVLQGGVGVAKGDHRDTRISCLVFFWDINFRKLGSKLGCIKTPKGLSGSSAHVCS